MSFTTTFTLATAILCSIASTFATHTPMCFQLDHKICATSIQGMCVHNTQDYSFATDVHSGSVELFVPTLDDTRLEMYTANRTLEDSCTPESYTSEIECTQVVEQGSCCYDGSMVHMAGLGAYARCLHDLVQYDTHLPVSGVVSWNTTNPVANYEVEVYGHESCECFMHAITCSPCPPV
jgi:hypothetical protein